MTTQIELRNLVWQACTVIRNEHRDVKKYVEYVALLLFFKFYDDLRDTLPKDVQGLIPNKYRWSVLKSLDPRGFLAAHPQVLIRLREFFDSKAWIGNGNFGAIFDNFQFDIKHDEVLGRALATLDRINFAGMDYDQKGEVYEYLIGKMADAGVKGEFFTPRPIVNMVIDILGPRYGMKVWDPACGTGGFLTRAFEEMKKDLDNTHAIGSTEHDCGLTSLRSGAVYGSETESVSARLARMNMILHGDGHSTILEFNSLDQQSYTEDQLEIRGKRETNPLPAAVRAGGFNLILGNPPYGGSQAVSDVNARFKPWHRSAKPESNFLQLMMHTLAPGGRCGVLMPEGVLFRREEAKLRERLLKDFELEAVVGLFKGAFEFADVKACVLVIRRPHKRERWKGTQNVWITETRSFNDINNVAERFAVRATDEMARAVPIAELRLSKIVLRPGKYLKVPPASEVQRVLFSDAAAVFKYADLISEEQPLVEPNDIMLSADGTVLPPFSKTVPVTQSPYIVIRSKENYLDPRLLSYFVKIGPLAKSLLNKGQNISPELIQKFEIPFPHKEVQAHTLQRLETQAGIAFKITRNLAESFKRDWVDDSVFTVKQHDILSTSFDGLVDDASDYVDPTEMPDAMWKVYGVTNDAGVRLGEVKLGRDFKAGRKYKRLIEKAIVYNPQRINVGSVGMVEITDNLSIISPYYPQFTCREELNSEFALNLIRSPYFRRLIEETAVGAVRHELFFSLFTQIEVPIPNPDEQSRILATIDAQVATFTSLDAVRSQVAKTMEVIIDELFSAAGCAK